MTISWSLLDRHDLFKWGFWLKFSLSMQLNFHLSFSNSPTTPLPFLWVWSLPFPFSSLRSLTHLTRRSFLRASVDWMWQIISIQCHLAHSSCITVRVLTLYELVMRYGLVATVIYYGSRRKWCCDDFSPVAACLLVRPWLYIHSNAEIF